MTVTAPPTITEIAGNPTNQSRMSYLESASYWAGNFAVGLTAAAALAGILAWIFSSRLATEKDAALKRFQEESKIAIASADARSAEANERAAEANKIAEGERLARVKLEATLAKRSSLMSQPKQNELAARLAKFKGQRGTIIASPSTQESEWFVRVLAAPLRQAGWDITPLPGTPTATVLYPTGVVIGYPFTGKAIPAPEPHAELANALNEWGIAAAVTSSPLKKGNTIEIIVSEK